MVARTPLFREAAKAAYLAYQDKIVADPRHRLRWEDLSRAVQDAWVAAAEAATSQDRGAAPVSDRHLYRVTVQVTLDMVVLAESPEQARDWTADDNWLDEVDRGCPEVRVLAPTRIRDTGDLPDRGWLDAHPYAADGTATRETVKEMLSARGTDG